MQYVVRRLAALVPTMFIMAAGVFLLVRVIPGDVVSLLSEGRTLSPQQADELRAEHGLDKPIPAQFVEYLGQVARGDFGESIWTGQPVLGEFKRRLPVTAELTALASVFSLGLGISVGVVSALNRDRWPDYILRGITVAGLSVPGFWLATLAILLPSIWWGYIPPLRYVSILDDPGANLRQFLVPAFLMSLYPASFLMRMTRSSVLDVLREDYIRTARSKGLAPRTVIIRHALRNSLIPIITLFGAQFAALLGGTVVFETVFNIRGVGAYTVDAVNQRDYPIIQGVNLFLGLGVLLTNLLVDLSYATLDPRVRIDS